MRRTPISQRFCPNISCPLHGRLGKANIVRHGFVTLRRCRHRRYRCTACTKTFCSTAGTPYHRLQCSRSAFDEVAAMSVEGVSKSSIARIKGISWNTVARWIERAAAAARRFNHFMTRAYELKELQADEIRTFLSHKARPIWVFSAIEVSSRLWPSAVIGRRSYRNARRLIRHVAHKAHFNGPPFITTDGFPYYGAVIHRLFGPACVYGQVMKTWRNNRGIKVERNLLVGSDEQLDDALLRSEDSSKLNTAFIERLNLTIRQGSAYLSRRSPCHARSHEHLEGHLELLRCYYNFVRPHRGLKFGKQMRTPAMQAGLASRRLTFREVFTSAPTILLFVVIVFEHYRRFDRVRSCRKVA